MEDNENLKKAFFEDVMGLPISVTILLKASEDNEYIYACPKTTLGSEKFLAIFTKLDEFNGEYLHDEKGRGFFRFKKKF